MAKRKVLDRNVKQLISNEIKRSTNKVIEEKLPDLVKQEMINSVKKEIEENVEASISKKILEQYTNQSVDKYSKWSLYVAIITLVVTIAIAFVGWDLSKNMEKENNRFLPLNYKVDFTSGDYTDVRWEIGGESVDSIPILSVEFKISEYSDIASGDYQGMYISMINGSNIDSRYVTKKGSEELYSVQYDSDESPFSITYSGKSWENTKEKINFLFNEKYYIQILQNNNNEKTMLFSAKENDIDEYKILIISLKGYNKDYQNIVLVFKNYNGFINYYYFDENTLHNSKEIQYGMEQLKINNSEISKEEFTRDLNNQVKTIKKSLE